MTEFETAMVSACESTLRKVLGQSAFASTVYHLSRSGVTLLDCARRPEKFDDALSAVFNPVGAMLIEGRILKSFHKTYNGGEFDWGERLNFCQEVRRARQAFKAAQASKQAS